MGSVFPCVNPTLRIWGTSGEQVMDIHLLNFTVPGLSGFLRERTFGKQPPRRTIGERSRRSQQI
jgi:hypothetical protein